MELTRQEAIKKHRELWHEITRRTLEEKRKVLLKDIRLDDTPNRLWLCEYNMNQLRKCKFFAQRCFFCPLRDLEQKGCLNGLIDKWRDCKDYSEAAELAEEIANLPEVNFNDADPGSQQHRKMMNIDLKFLLEEMSSGRVNSDFEKLSVLLDQIKKDTDLMLNDLSFLLEKENDAWKKCNDEMPKRSGWYLCSCYNPHNAPPLSGYKYVEKLYWDDRRKEFIDYVRFYEHRFMRIQKQKYYSTKYVIAWQTLPKTYDSRKITSQS